MSVPFTLSVICEPDLTSLVITVKYTEDEQETQTVEKTLTIYVGDETGDDRYVKVDDSKEVYTITKDSLTDILDSTMSP